MSKISIDNGNSFVSPEKAIEEMGLEEIATWMDDEVREQVHSMSYSNDLEFLELYLKTSDHDLIIG